MKLCVEAEHALPALEHVRKARKEGVDLNGMSIEFLSSGCKAIDPGRRLKYLVSRAPDDAPLSGAEALARGGVGGGADSGEGPTSAREGLAKGAGAPARPAASAPGGLHKRRALRARKQTPRGLSSRPPAPAAPAAPAELPAAPEPAPRKAPPAEAEAAGASGAASARPVGAGGSEGEVRKRRFLLRRRGERGSDGELAHSQRPLSGAASTRTPAAPASARPGSPSTSRPGVEGPLSSPSPSSRPAGMRPSAPRGGLGERRSGQASAEARSKASQARPGSDVELAPPTSRSPGMAGPGAAAGRVSRGPRTLLGPGSQASRELQVAAGQAKALADRPSGRGGDDAPPGEIAPPDSSVPPVSAEALEQARRAARALDGRQRDEEQGIDYQLLSSKDVDPSSDSPLAYHERIYGTEPGIEMARLEQFVLGRQAEVVSALIGKPGGNVVSLAVFDHVFDDRPRRPPVATLRWKDWRPDEPELTFFPYEPDKTVRSKPPPPLAPEPADSSPEERRSGPRTSSPAAETPAAKAPEPSAPSPDAKVEPSASSPGLKAPEPSASSPGERRSRPRASRPEAPVSQRAPVSHRTWPPRSSGPASSSPRSSTAGAGAGPRSSPPPSSPRSSRPSAPEQAGAASDRGRHTPPQGSVVPKRLADLEEAKASTPRPAARAAVVAPVDAEPVDAEPVVAEPVVAEPVIAEPVIAEPVIAEPVIAEPVIAEPVIVERAVAETTPGAAVVNTAAVEAGGPMSRRSRLRRSPRLRAQKESTPEVNDRATSNDRAVADDPPAVEARAAAPPAGAPASRVGPTRQGHVGPGANAAAARANVPPIQPPAGGAAPEGAVQGDTVVKSRRSLRGARRSSEPPRSSRSSLTPRERASNLPPRPSVPTGLRLRGDDLLTDLFEAIADLHFLANPLDGADFVLALSLEKLPSQVGLVSLFDINTRQYVVVRQTGGARSGLLLRLPEKSKLQQNAMRLERAIVVPDVRKKRQYLDPRWAELGITPRSIICAPVVRQGRYLGLIELANPHDGKPFSEGDGNALTYIGGQFADFLDSCGVVLDPEEIIAGAEAEQS